MLTGLKNRIRKFLEIKDPEPIDKTTQRGASGMTLAEEEALMLNAEAKMAMNENYLFDFRNYQADNAWSIGGTGLTTTFTASGTWTNAGEVVVQGEEPAEGSTGVTVVPLPTKPVGKIKLKPVEVVHELEYTPDVFNLNNLDDKIAVLKDKRDLIKQHYAKREVEGLIERLENRKKYMDFKPFFEQYKNTTDQKIAELLEKYELVMKTSDIFIPEFPDEAISAMKNYTEVLGKLCGKKPVFYVIAEEDKFRKAYEKRDPILLVQSPFGFFWQILGAWDKEMLILSEL